MKTKHNNCNYIKLVYLLVAFAFVISAGFSQERITSYSTAIQIKASGEVWVEENITVKAEGKQIKRGIYRSFPTTYKDQLGNRFKVGFEVKKVLKDGKSEPFFTTKESNGVVVYIGDENTYLTSGIYTYTLVYVTTRQIGFFEDFDELYFNAIGGDWVFPIEKAEVQIRLPQGAEVLQFAAFTGKKGATTCQCKTSTNGNVISLSTTEPLQPKEQLTFAVAWPKGLVTEPTTAEKWSLFFSDNFHVLFALVALVIVFLLYYWAWKKVGVDPPKGTIIPLYEPPAGFSPAEVALLHKLSMSQRAITASIVNLAVKGYLQIQYINKKYTLEKKASDNIQLFKEEEVVAAALFEKSNTIELNQKNHTAISKATSAATKMLKKNLSPTYFSFNYKHLVIGILASIIFGVLTFVFSPSPLIPVLFIISIAVLVMVFTYLIKAPTIKGRAIMDDIEGFKMYVKVAEQDQLNAAHAPNLTPQRFEALLPFAIALGVENEWGKKFERALSNSLQQNSSYQPSWYMGAATGMVFSASTFGNDLGSNFSTAISSASTPPGSSSGSGGGGFSGGGGGGGGGGGW